MLCFVASVASANIFFSDALVSLLNLRYLIALLLAMVMLDDFALLSLRFCEFL